MSDIKDLLKPPSDFHEWSKSDTDLFNFVNACYSAGVISHEQRCELDGVRLYGDVPEEAQAPAERVLHILTRPQ